MTENERGPWPWLGGGTRLSAPWGEWSVALAMALGLTRPERFALLGETAVGNGAEAQSLLAAIRLARGPAGPTALAIGLPLALFGLSPAPASLIDLNRLITLHEARVRLALDPDEGDLKGVRANAWLDALSADPEVALARAGTPRSLPRRMEVLATLTRPGSLAKGQALWRGAREATHAWPWPSALRSFLDQLDQCANYVEAALRFRGLAASIAPRTTPPDTEERRRCRQAAADFLQRPGALANTWEVQAWGVGEHPGPLVSPWFPPGLVLQALHEAGFDQTGPITALLANLPQELRWYAHLDRNDPAAAGRSGEVWRGIPPDSDSLGLMLQLQALVPALPPGRAEGWMRYLWASLPADHRIPTWFYVAPGGGSSIEGPAWQYASNDCTSSRLTCLLGLLGSGLPGADGLVKDNLALLLPAFLEPGRSGDFFYDEATADLGLLRLARAWIRHHPLDPFSELVRTSALSLTHRLLATQGHDGGWGSTHGTAARLAGIALWEGDDDALRRATRWLAEAQRPDGSWPAEPLYLMPGKSLHEIAYHSSFELTTALCLRALHSAELALGRRNAG